VDQSPVAQHQPAAGNHMTHAEIFLDHQQVGVAAGNQTALAAQDWTRRANRRITLEEALEDVRLSLLEGEN